jgi:hypothetical protein
VVATALLAACGGSSGGAVVILPSPDVSSSPLTASAAATPEGTPLTGTPRQAIATFWRLVDANDYAALAAAAAPGAPGLPTADNDDIERVELVRTVRVERQPGMALVQVDVRVDPSSAATPWGDPGRHTLFVRLLEQSPGKWLVAGWGTSP